MEVNIVRPFMVRTLQAFYKHDSPQMVPQADTTGSEHDMHVPITCICKVYLRTAVVEGWHCFLRTAVVEGWHCFLAMLHAKNVLMS